jgi:2'-5' RNA ligase
MRVFAALKLPPDFRSSLEENLRVLRERYPRFRWTGEENLHITLAFLGEIEKPGLIILEEAAERAIRGRGPIPISGERFLPRGRDPRVLALGIEEGREALAALAAALEGALAALGKERGCPVRPPEKRPFRAHITLARRGASPLEPVPDPAFPLRGTLRELAIFRSELFPEGPRYTPLKVYPLDS